MTLHVACCLWDANLNSREFSRRYDETWVEKLYSMFRRNLTVPFKFVVFTDRERSYLESRIYQIKLTADVPDYGSMIEPFRLNEPSIVVGLDTVVLGNIDQMARYCLTGDKVAIPNHPSIKGKKINPIALVPKGNRGIFDRWCGENDMDWLQQQDTVPTDLFWPGQILSLKLHDVRRKGTQGGKIIYFHGEPKADSMLHVDWVREHWR
jgi:hypothetical protein